MPLTKKESDEISKRLQYHFDKYKKSIIFNCRFHPDPSQAWHEIGCPHKDWTKEQLRDAVIHAKAINKIYFDVLFPGNITEVDITNKKES